MDQNSTPLPRGFRVAGVHCGIKQRADALDLSLVLSEREVVAAGVYTQNLIVAAPVAWDRDITPSDRVRAVLINSGNANACTGKRGAADTAAMAAETARAIGASAEQVLILSTGIIGEYLPMEAIRAGIPVAVAQAGSDEPSLLQAARAIMTTDRVPKVSHRSFSVGDRSVQLTGIAKGAGMIGPRMATMLAVIMTDAALAPEAAQRFLRSAVERSFNCISVEGHTSTNDTVLLLASGEIPLDSGAQSRFADELEELAIDLAKRIPADGEGATHLITIQVQGAPDEGAARQVARTIADSPLVKTAITGADPNWGRIVSAAGYAGVPFPPERLRLSINGVALFAKGVPLEFDATALSESMRRAFDVRIELELGMGEASCTFWTSDLTHEYITINAEYHT